MVMPKPAEFSHVGAAAITMAACVAWGATGFAKAWSQNVGNRFLGPSIADLAVSPKRALRYLQNQLLRQRKRPVDEKA